MVHRDRGVRRQALVGAGRLPVVVVGVAIGLGLVLPRPVSSLSPNVRQESPVDAKQVYLADCAVCHGEDGRGIENRGISLFDQGRAAVDYSLTTGRMPLAAVGRAEVAGRPVAPLPDVSLGDPGQIPTRHEPAYPPEVIKALVDYVAELTDETGPEIPVLEKGDVAEGGVQFRLQCAACHSWSGQGGALVERPVPALGASTPIQVAEAVRAGPGQMPAFGQAALDDHQLSSIVAYVEELNKPSDRGGHPLGRLGPVTEGAVALVGLAALLALCRWIGEREPEGGDEPEAKVEPEGGDEPTGKGEPEGGDQPTGKVEPEGGDEPAGKLQPSGSGGAAE
ncbi:MAG: hypothetical protein AVDCRST_MAG76-3539 [uncultured Acidimicrobiales bacterium]|uniref:Cytochrome c domain-containing protein n=2 Tax=uncultured Acidimicrobiales bacterium TaxID=310071 RepID=A0A6J4JBH8_9ACTN|nr:MAG: hypothetical protein AVDCRST_MAG76-3539 [uncultured Acidimicrobiales bacterium]